MGIITEAVRHLLAAGVTGDALLQAIKDMEEANPAYIQDSENNKRSTGAIRQARYRNNRAQRSALRNTLRSDVTSVTKRNESVTGDAITNDTLGSKEVSKKESKTLGSRFTLTELPDDWRKFCQAKRPDLDPSELFEEFGDYWRGIPGAKGRKLDWEGTWRNRVRDKRGKPKTNGPPKDHVMPSAAGG